MKRGGKRILVIHSAGIGDMMLSVPALLLLREKFRPATIVEAGIPERLELLKAFGVIDEAISFERRLFALAFRREGPASELTEFLEGFDIVISWMGGGNLGENLKRAGAKRLVCSALSEFKEGCHRSEFFLRSLSSLGIMGEVPRFRLRFSNGKQGFGKSPPSESARPLLAIHPGSGHLSKAWPAENFSRVAERFISTRGGTILIIIGPNDEVPGKELADILSPAKPIVVKGKRLLEIARYLEKADIYLGNDSGISHIAGAIGLPSIVIFGPTDPRLWAPLGERVITIKGKSPCAPCTRQQRLACTDRRCLASVSVEEVWQKIRQSSAFLFQT